MIYTFYSFKGGVGRSMAMASVAWLLARRGLHVLAIDFDLEAPGLERYFFDEESLLTEVRSRPGLIELLLAYKRAYTSESEFERADFKRWQEFVVDAVPRTPEGGSVDIMTSGRRHPQERYAEYALAVRAFDWQDFLQNWHGGRFFDWLRRVLTAEEGAYDVVLVDSRTGVTEMGGVCAYQLADVAVLLCAPNYQNLDGTRAVLSDFRSDAVLALRQGRPLELLVVPARVEPSDDAKRRRFFGELNSMFGSEGLPRALADAGLDYERLALPYEKELGIIERVVDEATEGGATGGAARTAIRGSLETLADALLQLMPSDGRWAGLRTEAAARLRGEAPEALHPGLQADATRRGAGADVLIIGSAGDRALCEQLAEALARRGVQVWLDSIHLKPSASWADALERQIKYARAVLLCIGEQPPSQWYWAAYRVVAVKASHTQRAIVGAVIAGTEAPEECAAVFGLPPDAPLVDCRGREADDAAAALHAALLPASGAPAEAPLVVDPYPGADPYCEDNAALLFGREAETTQLFELVRTLALVVLEGSPGVGKGSLVRAGVVPRLRGSEMGGWAVTETDLSAADAAAQVDALCAARREQPVLHVIYAFDSFPHGGGPSRRRERVEWILRVTELLGPRRKLLLVGCGNLPPDERDRALTAWFEAHRGERAVMRLEPLDLPRLREAIERPAGRAGHLFEPGLVDRLIGDAGTQPGTQQGTKPRTKPGALAQIQLALRDIWAGRRRGWLTNKAYDQGGGIAGRYAARLDAFLAEHGDRWGFAAQTLLKNLVQFDSLLQLFAEPVRWEMLATIPAIAEADAEALRDRLATARLIDLWHADGGLGGEVLWCALAQPVPGRRIEDWARDDVEFLLWRRRFATYLAAPGAGAGASLVAGEELAVAEGWLARYGEQMFEDERELIRRSVEAREEADRARLAHEKARRRRRLELIGIGAAMAGVLLGASMVAYFVGARTEADEARRQWELVDAERTRAAMVAMNLQQVQESLSSLSSLAGNSDALASSIAMAQAELQVQSANLSGIAEDPTPASRPAGTLAPRVYIQISAGSQREAANALRGRIGALDASGAAPVVPGVELVKTPVPRSVVRCFEPEECRGEGRRLTDAINGLLARPRLELEDLSERYGGSKSIRPRHYEIWFAEGDIVLEPR